MRIIYTVSKIYEKKQNKIGIITGAISLPTLISAWAFFRKLDPVINAVIIIDVFFVSFVFLLLFDLTKKYFLWKEIDLGRFSVWLSKMISEIKTIESKYKNKKNDNVSVNIIHLHELAFALSVWRKKVFIVLQKIKAEIGPFENPDLLSSEMEESKLARHIYDDEFHLAMLRYKAEQKVISLDVNVNKEIF